MINLNLIISFITCLTLNTNTNVEKYSEALNLIIKSTEYQSYKIDYNISDENYVVSEEILPFADFAIVHNMEKYIKQINYNEEFVTRTDKELLRLNKRRRGNVKIFFTEESDNLFFAQVFYTTKKRSLKYSEAPSFGARYLYTFKHEKGTITLLKVNQMHYN
ncbi:hypothetical protein GCM10007424_24480 [Flavobacterium suaedae]|uniref:Uncharacterized protein n=1 Tax=Flavobacterium suaedae TaxID=1767027 RepID=A0ABQ1K3P2_9FLAO|nr:hypothetical protein [Flavobacterium suaedae]GGB83571.1 hypothetical protein GCM10007424_24480 [Flavobacterium suaedae]